MKRMLYGAVIALIVVVIGLAIVRLVLPSVLRGADDRTFALLFVILFATSLNVAVLIFELVIGRAFGQYRFSMVSRDEDPDEYWSRIRFRILLVPVIIIAALLYHYFGRRH